MLRTVVVAKTQPVPGRGLSVTHYPVTATLRDYLKQSGVTGSSFSVTGRIGAFESPRLHYSSPESFKGAREGAFVLPPAPPPR